MDWVKLQIPINPEIFFLKVTGGITPYLNCIQICL